MKNIFILLVCFLSFSSFACSCLPQSITEKYIESDFVAIVTIVKNYPNEKDSQIYRADIEINELFKGEKLKSIYVYGRSDNEFGTSCDIFIPVNTKLVAYANKNKDGVYVVGMCSGLFYLNKNSIQYQNELLILNTFKLNKISFTDKTNYIEISRSSEKLEKYKSIQLEKNYGIYEITFKSDLSIQKVEKISGFDNPIDDELMELLRSTKWAMRDRRGEKIEAQDSCKLLIGLYFYHAGKDYKSFISYIICNIKLTFKS